MGSADTKAHAIRFLIDDSERIPVQRYFDDEFYQAELEHLWPHVWQMACRLEQIPEVGDWIEYTNIGYSIIVVRTRDGVKAFHNACRHRGVPFAGGTTVGSSHSTAHGNCTKSGFVCPFHGWRWNMDGENTFVYGKHLFSDRQLDPEDINLIPCRVETWGGCAWINFDDDAPSVRECLGPVAERLEAHGVDNLRAEWWFGTVLPANWKLAMEAFMEGYHVMKTHPQLHATLTSTSEDGYAAPTGSEDTLAASRTPSVGITTGEAVDAQIKFFEVLGEGMGGMIHAKEIEIARGCADDALPDDAIAGVGAWYGIVQDQISKQLQERGERVPDLNAVCVSHPINTLEFLFPHFFLLPVFTSMSSYRIRPLGPESCFFEIWSLTQYPAGEEPDPVMEPTVLPYDSAEFPPIPRQDYSNIPIQQRGLHAKGFEFMRLAKDVEGLVGNYQRIIDGYLTKAPPEKLASAIHHLGGNFDGKLLDLGLP